LLKAASDRYGKGEKHTGIGRFELWLKTKFTDAFWFKGHKFEKTENEDIMIDGGYFTSEEAKQLFRMLNSRNPIVKLNATY